MTRTGDEYFDSKEFREKLEQYLETTEAGQPVFMDADDLADIADYYHIIGEGDRAEQIIDEAIELHPGATLPLVYKARKALDDGNPRRAMSIALKVIDREDPEYTYLLAEIHIAQGKPEEAEEMLAERFEETNDEDEREDLIIDAANIFVDNEMYDRAEKWLEKAQDTEHDDYKELQARILFAKGKYQDSADIFNELIDRNPYSKRDWQGLASAQFMLEEFNESVTSSEYALAIDPDDPNSLMAKANAMFRLENYEQAYEYYRRYCERAPKDEYGEMSQGIALMGLNRPAEAIPHFDKALEIAQPHSHYRAQILQEKAFAYSETGDFDKALDTLDLTEAIDCDHNEVDLIRGHIFLMKGDFRRAETFFKIAIKHSPDVPTTLLRVVVSLHENGYLEAAHHIFRQLMTIYGDDLTNGYSYMALCCNDMKRPDEFLQYLKLATEKNPKEAKTVLGRLFPKELEPSQYYEYAKGIWGA